MTHDATTRQDARVSPSTGTSPSVASAATAADESPRLERARARRRGGSVGRSRFLLALYLILMLLPIYWLINMSLQSNSEILGALSFWPREVTFDNYIGIFTDSNWYMGYVNSIAYVSMNMLISISVALPAAYAFSRFKFIGDKHLFFWLLTNLMAPPAVFLLPYFQLYYSVGLFDTHIAVALAHCLFNIPLAVWILEGFMSSVPKEVDETAYIDGYSFPSFFVKIFIPMIRSGIGVTLFFLFMFSWVELLLSRTLTATNAQPIASIMTRTSTASGIDWGTLAAAGVLTILPGIIVVYFVRNHIAKGFALGRT
ncbi:carbohydrate ABC transporter permease [Halomonas heilongjiangensis]|uniref:Sugar ABC transporter permease n=1 Tax=Halomonas heilongjiangensis TaxID=1387883 RepID=A0A2N7TTD5_9GAMM|nr:carbohydrate ABC transporter permease [Halomonas heilongjiangensis]PMR71437.1 sugar ABC transporter permease [Halomonas heilongjiangensis]PXX88725.1 sugar ABC transporter permease [Halomonas heilongjiangensis]